MVNDTTLSQHFWKTLIFTFISSHRTDYNRIDREKYHIWVYCRTGSTMTTHTVRPEVVLPLPHALSGT